MPDDLAKRIAKAERGIFDDEDDVERRARKRGRRGRQRKTQATASCDASVSEYARRSERGKHL